ncbi:MAG: DUF928 domain-containing protein [Cyanobacteria bacterium P01_A01_bin.84]
MRRKIIASTLGIFALITSGAWIPSEVVHAVTFSPPKESEAPSKATGGGSRGSLFTPKSGESAPSKATGGGARGNLFTPKSGESAPSKATGGGARGNLFTPQSGESAPSKAISGGSRGDSSSISQSDSHRKSRDGRIYLNLPNVNPEQPAAILALLPQTYFGTTVSQRPDILVYLPVSQARGGVFSLKDEQGNTLHEMNLPVSGKAEIISIKVPINLQLEKNYQWFLALKIDGKLSPRTPYVDGWIKRIQPNNELTKSMLQKDLLKQATAFGKHGVWYDCIAALAKLRNAQPNQQNINQHWSQLLASVELANIDKAPVVTLNNNFN